MSWDIYGRALTPGHCEVHPDEPEPYPCYYCRARQEPVECCASGRCEVCAPGHSETYVIASSEGEA